MAAIFSDNVPCSFKLSVFLRYSVFFEAVMVVSTQISQFLLSTLRPTSILLNCVKKPACDAGAEKNRKEEMTAAIFRIPTPFCECRPWKGSAAKFCV